VEDLQEGERIADRRARRACGRLLAELSSSNDRARCPVTRLPVQLARDGVCAPFDEGVVRIEHASCDLQREAGASIELDHGSFAARGLAELAHARAVPKPIDDAREPRAARALRLASRLP